VSFIVRYYVFRLSDEYCFVCRRPGSRQIRWAATSITDIKNCTEYNFKVSAAKKIMAFQQNAEVREQILIDKNVI
jgi:hypothetical protein